MMTSRIVRGFVATATLAVGVAVVAGCGETEARDSEGAAEYAAVERRDIELVVEATGEVEPIRIVEVKSKASGEILALHVDTGDDVERGSLLAAVDPRDVRNDLAQAEAELEVARARLAIAEARRKRTAELQQANVATEQEYETAALEEANARAQLVKAQVTLELARERMGDVTIRAPLAGTVIRRDVEAGQIIASASQNISGGTTLLLMADLSEMQVRMLVDETDIGRIQPGQSALINVDAHPGRTFEGSILKIEPKAVVEQNVVMFPVLIHLDNRERLLKPGMTAQVRVEIARRDDIVAIPNSAVVSARDAGAAAELLGLDAQAAMAALRPPRPAASDGDGAAAADAGNGSAAEECMALFQRLRASGDFSSISEAERARLRECRDQMGGMGGPPGGRGQMARGGGPAGGPDARDETSRSALVFVASNGRIEPRRVVLGVSDWDYTEVISGVEPGERLVLMSVARIQQQQQDFMNRVRQRNAIFPSTQQQQQQQPQQQRGAAGR